MTEEFEWEEMADDAVATLRAAINTEAQVVEVEHELYDKLTSWDYIIGHLDERIPAELPHLHSLSGEVSVLIVEIRELIEGGEFSSLKIIQEDEASLTKLQGDIAHKNWRAVKEDVEKERALLRLREEELKTLHEKFAQIMRIMERDNLIAAIREDLTTERAKAEFEKLEEHYFLALYKFARAYEQIFRQLWEKEKALAAK